MTCNMASEDLIHFDKTVCDEYNMPILQLIINLVDVNDEVPFFGPEVYVTRDVKEDVTLGHSIIEGKKQVELYFL